MKKLLFLITLGAFTLGGYSQALDDQAIIPVSISLNTIMRLNVTSGGNIEFVFSNLEQYDVGIPNSTRYDTKFNVASSVDFNVELYTEDAELLGSDDPTRTLALNYLEYTMSTADGTGSTLGAGGVLVQGPTAIVTNNTGNAGDINQNDFTIGWSAGETNSLLAGSPIADRYTTNVFLILSAD